MKIAINDIYKLAGEKTYYQGLLYFNNNQVALLQADQYGFFAQVRDFQNYHVRVKLVDEELVTSCGCRNLKVCKHVVAAMLAARQHYNQTQPFIKPRHLRPVWENFFESFLMVTTGEKDQPNHSIELLIVFTIELHSDRWQIGPQKLQIKKDGQFGKLTPLEKFNDQARKIAHAPNDPILINYLYFLAASKSGRYYNLGYYQLSRYLKINFLDYGSKIGQIFNLLRQSQVYQIKEKEIIQKLHISDAAGKLEFRLIEKTGGFQLQPFLIWQGQDHPIESHFKVLTENPVWLLWQDKLIQLENTQCADLIIHYLKENKNLIIPSAELPNFFNQYHFLFKNQGDFVVPEKFPIRTINRIDGKRLYLSESESHLLVRIKVLYRDIEIDVLSEEDDFQRMNGAASAIFQINRDLVAERQLVDRLVATGVKLFKDGQLKLLSSRAFIWIFETIPLLAREGFEIFGQEKLARYKYNLAQPRIRFDIQTQIDWFDLNVKIDFSGIQLSMAELKSALKKQSRYVKLLDGSFGILPDDWMQKFSYLFNLGRHQEQHVRLSKAHLTLIELMLEQADSANVDTQLQEQMARLRQFEQIESQKLPEKFNGSLRGYQMAGFDWFYFLKRFGFGGCLADDMGLGKTIQALALLQNEKNLGAPAPSLVVCPTSVIFNWEHELKKFTPGLRVHSHTGMNRPATTAGFERYDVVLTSYGIVLRDIWMLAKLRFHYVILDESQKLKNPLSLTAHAVRQLQCNHRLALTGTPVENNTIELWSLFAFLNPGLLGTANYFKKAFASQIEKKQNVQVAEQLRRLIFPFILRRTKDQVARELPPKIEQISYCHMTESQQHLYERWRDFYRALILKQIDQDGINRSKMNILAGLTRLRLIACHPTLVDRTVAENSGKFELLFEILEDILSEKHKVLVFSQFTKMLRLIRSQLDLLKIRYEYLDGHSRDRETSVVNFQTDDQVKIFLISLKAGGTGLNLTAADYVIHYDPWWNPAVEVQATDRSHRIGQDKNVIVYKLITRGTIEEKILQLQEHKKNLVEQIITTDASFFKKLSRKDVEILFS